MAGMSTVLTEFADNGDSRTCTTSGHTASKPKLVIQKRKVPVGNEAVAEYSFSVVHGTEDAEGLPLPQRVSFTATVRYPVAGDAADISAALAIFKDAVAGDEFAASVTSQNWMVNES